MPVPVFEAESWSLNISAEPVAAPYVKVVVNAAIESELFDVGLRSEDQRGDPPSGAQPVAFPLARTPIGALPTEQRLGAACKAVAVAELPVEFWFNVETKLAGIRLLALYVVTQELPLLTLGMPVPDG